MLRTVHDITPLNKMEIITKSTSFKAKSITFADTTTPGISKKFSNIRKRAGNKCKELT